MKSNRIFRFFILIVIGILQFGYCAAAEIHGIDLYGSDHLTVERMLEAEPILFAQFCEQVKAENEEKAEEIRLDLSDKIQRHFSLAYLRLSPITYFEGQKKVVYVTFDVVESKDAKKRMNFLELPQEVFEDPDQLIAAWDLYMNTAFELLQKGEIDSQVVECDAAFHYIFGHQHPQLAPFEKLFVEGVAKNKEQLINIFLRDHRDHQRACAAFLLAYLPNGQELVKILSKRLRDPSAEVRNNVMRVFAVIASDHPEISLPVNEILPALDFPNTTDRNKAAAIIYGLLSHESSFNQYSKKILTSSSLILLKMLRLKQPNNSEWAYRILKKISKEEFPKDSFEAWQQWVDERLKSLHVVEIGVGSI